MTEGNTMAFPLSTPHEIQGTGLTKREYFAAMAMQGILARGDSDQDFNDRISIAVDYADALIEQLNKT